MYGVAGRPGTIPARPAGTLHRISARTRAHAHRTAASARRTRLRSIARCQQAAALGGDGHAESRPPTRVGRSPPTARGAAANRRTRAAEPDLVDAADPGARAAVRAARIHRRGNGCGLVHQHSDGGGSGPQCGRALRRNPRRTGSALGAAAPNNS